MRLLGWLAAGVVLSLAQTAHAQAAEPVEATDPQPQTEAQPGQTQDDGASSPDSERPAPIDLIAQTPKEQAPVEETRTGPGGVELGLRLDAEVPVGELFGGTSVSSKTSGQAAVQLDLGWRIDEAWTVGAFGRYGLAFVSSCTDTVTCAAHDVRMGVDGQLHLGQMGPSHPWLGLGLGWEFLTLSSNGAPTPPSNVAVETTVTYDGPVASLDLGADFRLSDSMGVGPYFEATAGQYQRTANGDLLNKGLHVWLGLGVRGWWDVR